jgi:hypothetical protein
MLEFDWRSPEPYRSLQDAEVTDIAWDVCAATRIIDVSTR